MIKTVRPRTASSSLRAPTPRSSIRTGLPSRNGYPPAPYVLSCSGVDGLLGYGKKLPGPGDALQLVRSAVDEI